MNATTFTPKTILTQCTIVNPVDEAYLNHSVITRFGHPAQSIHIDQCNVDINGVTYEQPLVLPITNGQLELVQCAVLQDKKNVAIVPDGLAKGFIRYGDFHHNRPIIITYS